MITKDTVCIILAIFVAAFVLYLMIQESRKTEMFQMAHLIQILSNGDIMWYPSENQDGDKFGKTIPPFKGYQQPQPAIGNVQQYYIKCNENQQLCTSYSLLSSSSAKRVVELTLKESVRTLDFLLLTKLNLKVRELLTSTTMLAWATFSLLNCTLTCVTSLTLEEELLPLSATQATN